ncbi:MAG: hypothetical protein FWG69_00025 [Oscillospiraceae bacterium]|nr:hypothetical protein [Oscillospiraceae bacterium]
MFISEWWEGLSAIQQIFAGLAIPSTVILLVQTIMMLFGLGFGQEADITDTSAFSDGDFEPATGAGIEFDGETADFGAAETAQPHPDSYYDDGVTGMRLFTVRGIVAFLSVGGWIGIALIDLGMSPVPAGVLAFAAGVLSLLFVAAIFKWSSKLQESGNMNINRAVGHTAQVYITIPPEMQGRGKVMVKFDGRLTELDAVTTENRSFKPQQTVKIAEVLSEGLIRIEAVSINSKDKSAVH